MTLAKTALTDRFTEFAPLSTAAADYDIVRRAIAHIRGNWRAQPEIDVIADAAGVTAHRSASLVPPLVRADAESLPASADAQQRARACCAPRQACWTPPTKSVCPAPAGCTIYSSPMRRCRQANGRPAAKGSTITYGFHPCPFGMALVMTTPRGLAGLALADAGKERSALKDMRARWPRAQYVEDFAATAATARRIFDPALWRKDQPLRVVMIGTDFEVRVWEKLLDIPMGNLTTYSDLAARAGSPKAARAVGAAVGKNPICFVVPCHRVIGKSGESPAITGASRASARCSAGKPGWRRRKR